MAKKVAARTLDFSNVKESSGVNPKHKEEGEYLAKITEVRDDPAKDGEAMWCWIIKPADDAVAAYPYYVKLVDNQLWKLRNLFIAAGIAVPKKANKIDPNKVVGKTIGIVLEDDEYEGKLKSVISAVIPKEELSEYGGPVADDDQDDEVDEVDEDEEEAPAPKKRGRPAKVVVEEEDEDDEEEDEEPAPVKRGRPRKVVVEEEEDDEEEEEPAPAPKKRGRPKKVVEPEEDEDDEEDDEPVAPVKRGRGRPRKVVEEEEEEAPAPKKRGRPRKVVEEDDDLDLDL